jgi:class 3 adenylate cyclase
MPPSGRPAPSGARNVAVAFADLVGFARLGEAVPRGPLTQRLGGIASANHTGLIRFRR